MADQLKSVATLLLVLNFCMYCVVLGIGAWAMNRAIEHGFIIGMHIYHSISSQLPYILHLTHICYCWMLIAGVLCDDVCFRA